MVGTISVDVRRSVNVHPEGIGESGKDIAPVKSDRKEEDDRNNENKGGEETEKGPPVLPIRKEIDPGCIFTEEFSDGRNVQLSVSLVPVMGFLQNVF